MEFIDNISIVKFITYNESDKYEESRFLRGMGGFFQPGMRWEDYVNHFQPELGPLLEKLRVAIVEHNIKMTGAEHQAGREVSVPLFSDNTVATYSFRGWGDLMAAVWSSEEDTNYSYMDFYC